MSSLTDALEPVTRSHGTYERKVTGVYLQSGVHRRFVRIAGSLRNAEILTAPNYELGSDAPWVPQQVPGRVVVDPEGEVAIRDAPTLTEAAASDLAWSWRSALRDAGMVRLEQGRRYLAGHYVCLERVEAERLALISLGGPGASSDGAARARALAAIEMQDGVEVVHSTTSWALWSDGRLTTSLGLPSWATAIHSLPVDVAHEVSLIRGSDSDAPEGGWTTLLDVVAIEARETVYAGPGGGGYQRRTVERLTCQLRSGGTRTLWVDSMGYFEGYRYEVLLQPPPEVEAELAAQALAVEATPVE